MRRGRVWVTALAAGWLGATAPASGQDPADLVPDVGEAVFCCEIEELYTYSSYTYRYGECVNDVDPYRCLLLGGSPGLGVCDEASGGCVARLPTCCEYEGGCSSSPPITGQTCTLSGGESMLGVCNIETGNCQSAGAPVPAPPAP